jgi:uncharacterized membrane protein
MSDETPPGPPPIPDPPAGSPPPSGGAPPPPTGGTPPTGGPPPPPAGPTQSNRGVMIVLAYLWLLALVPLLVEKEDAEVQWHAKHGIVLMVAEIVLWIAVGIVSVVLSGFLACFVSIFWFALWVAILAVHITCIVKGVNGQRFIIPGLSEYADRF